VIFLGKRKKEMRDFVTNSEVHIDAKN